MATTTSNSLPVCNTPDLRSPHNPSPLASDQVPVIPARYKPVQPTKSTKPSKSGKAERPMSPSALQTLTQNLFNPNFRPPRFYRDPKPPTLASSRLPPPAAEIVERPRWRIRRFRMWRDAAPGLRIAVLDPRKRCRFNTSPSTHVHSRARLLMFSAIQQSI